MSDSRLTAGRRSGTRLWRSVIETLEGRTLLCSDPGLHALMGMPPDEHISGKGMSIEEISEIGNRTAIAGSSISVSPGSGGPAAITSAAPNGLPLLNSYPGAPAVIYLDFDGGQYQSGQTHSAYDIDGDPSTYNESEQWRITETWRRVSMYFSMFNVTVTTDDNVSGDRSWVLVGNDVSGGAGYINSFPDNSIAGARVNSSHAPNRSTGIAHEVGHNFGNQHTKNYNNLGIEEDEYHSAFDFLHGTIMGIDYGGIIQKFSYWHGGSVSSFQDPLAIIANDLDNYGGDGYKPDDDSDGSLSTPIALTIGTPKTGVIERLDDADVFSFVVPSGGGNYAISAVRDHPSPVDLKIEIYDNSGNLLASEDGDTIQAVSTPTTDEYIPNDHYISMNLAAGTYKVKVMSHANYNDQGQYIVRVDPLMNAANPAGSGPTRWQDAEIGTNYVPGFANYNSGTDTLTIGASGKEIYQEWDQVHFVYQTLTGDGSITARVTGFGLDIADAGQGGVMIRENLTEYSKMATTVMQYDYGKEFVNRTSSGGTANYVYVNGGVHETFAPTWVRLTRAGNVFTSQYSANGTTWTTIGTQNITMNSKVYIGLVADSANAKYLGTATFTNISLTGNINAQATPNALTPPTVTVGTTAYNSVALSWTNVSGDNGYSVERSTDGVNFTEITTRSSTQTTYTDSSGLAGGQRYWYRVRARTGSGGSIAWSNPSAAKSGVTRAGQPDQLNVIRFTGNEMIMNWRDVSGETGYIIQRATSSSGTYTNVGTTGRNQNLFRDTGPLNGNTTYWYRIVSTDASGNSATSANSSQTTRLTDITTISVTGRTSSSLTLGWNAVPGATTFHIDKWDFTAGDWAPYATSNSTAYTDSGLTPLTEHYYRVTATSGSNDNWNYSPQVQGVTLAAAAQALPSGWTDSDIGAVGGPGAGGFQSGTFTVWGSGTDIWDPEDQFHFVSTTMSGNGSITARISGFPNSDGAWTLGGVMIRDGTSGTAKHAAIIMGETQGFQLISRATAGGSSSTIDGPNVTAPYWMRLTRTGTTFLAETSANGTSWSTLGSVSISMNTSVRIGLVVTSNETRDFDMVTFTNVSTSFGGLLSSMPQSGGTGSSVESESATESLFSQTPVSALFVKKTGVKRAAAPLN